MNGKKIFAALVILTTLSTIIGAINYNSAETQIAAAAPIEMSAQAASISCISPTSAQVINGAFTRCTTGPTAWKIPLRK